MLTLRVPAFGCLNASVYRNVPVSRIVCFFYNGNVFLGDIVGLFSYNLNNDRDYKVLLDNTVGMKSQMEICWFCLSQQRR